MASEDMQFSLQICGVETDCQVIINQRIFKVHKIMLISRSNFFRNELDGQIEVSTMDLTSLIGPETFLKVLKFLYDLPFSLDNDSLLEMALAAERLDIGSLRELCLRHVASGLSPLRCLTLLEASIGGDAFGLQDELAQVCTSGCLTIVEQLKAASYGALVMVFERFSERASTARDSEIFQGAVTFGEAKTALKNLFFDWCRQRIRKDSNELTEVVESIRF